MEPQSQVVVAGIRPQSSQAIEFEQLVQWANPKVNEHKQLFNDIGMHCEGVDGAYKSLRSIIDTLRGDDVFLEDEASIQVAKSYIWEKYPDAASDTIDRYMSNLRHLLRCPSEHVPELPSITGSLAPWQVVGDSVDCLLDISRNQNVLTLEWWHCVIVDAGKGPTVVVFWVGTPPKEGSRRQLHSGRCNPSIVRRKDLRSHREDAYYGPDARYTVSYIRQHYISQRHGLQPLVSVKVPVGEEGDVDVGKGQVDSNACGNGSEAHSADDSTKGSESSSKGPSLPSKSPSKQKPALPVSKSNPAPRPAGRRGKGKGKPKNSNVKKKPKKGGGGSGSRIQADDQNGRNIVEPSVFDWIGPFLHSDRIEFDLNLLQTKPNLHTDEQFFAHYLQLLQRLRRGQGIMYGAAQKFKEYHVQQVSALTAYEQRCAVKFNSAKKAAFIKSMNTALKANYSDAFSRNELVVISCLLAYPGLTYTNIDQKTRVAEKSSMIRGMSFVPESVEQFFQKRLRMLQVIDDVNHPRHMEPFSTVVLNSTYCYRQIAAWGYGTEFTTWEEDQCPVTLQGFPDFLSVNGVYVRVRNDGCDDKESMLYAQVMSTKSARLLGISESLVKPHNDFARVLDVKRGEPISSAKVLCFLSKGLFQPADPICVASFSMDNESLVDDSGYVSVLTPQMFSHIGQDGQAIYQDILDWSPRAKCHSDECVEPNVSLEYGPDLVPQCVPYETTFRAAPLTEQAAHCDGNFYHAKGQWVEVNVHGQTGAPGHGLYRVSSHNPLQRRKDMETPNLIEPLLLRGLPHTNSLSFLFNVNGNTTLTFPPKSGSRGDSNNVDAVPFGGLSAFSFIKEHLGSEYGLTSNERPHLYAHSGDLRQFPVVGFGTLVLILAAKQRAEELRKWVGRDSADVPAFVRSRIVTLESGLKHFILQMLSTSTYKVDCQENILNQVQAAAIANYKASQERDDAFGKSTPKAKKRKSNASQEADDAVDASTSEAKERR
jgi:hypothetical protein